MVKQAGTRQSRGQVPHGLCRDPAGAAVAPCGTYRTNQPINQSTPTPTKGDTATRAQAIHTAHALTKSRNSNSGMVAEHEGEGTGTFTVCCRPVPSYTVLYRPPAPSIPPRVPVPCTLSPTLPTPAVTVRRASCVPIPVPQLWLPSLP